MQKSIKKCFRAECTHTSINSNVCDAVFMIKSTDIISFFTHNPNKPG